ncbi:hypothetical protein B0F90DRAFT_1786097, partial [Multifurca ochricompacta]
SPFFSNTQTLFPSPPLLYHTPSLLFPSSKRFCTWWFPPFSHVHNMKMLNILPPVHAMDNNIQTHIF